MKLDVKALAITLGLLWGGCLLVVGGAASVLGVKEGTSWYGKDFLLAMASVYPGYAGLPQWSDTLIGAGLGFVDGALAGLILAWLYNLLSGAGRASAA